MRGRNRIGLSATLNPIEKSLAAFLAGYDVARGQHARTPRPIKIVRADDRVRTMDLQVVAPGAPELGPLATHPQLGGDVRRSRAGSSVSIARPLVFTLEPPARRAGSRSICRRKRLGTDAVMAHHGSLARQASDCSRSNTPSSAAS